MKKLQLSFSASYFYHALNCTLLERAQHLQAMPYERSAQRVDHANGFKNKTVLIDMDEVTFEPPKVRSGGFYSSALDVRTVRNQVSRQAHTHHQRPGALEQGAQAPHARGHAALQRRRLLGV